MKTTIVIADELHGRMAAGRGRVIAEISRLESRFQLA
jgi:hypothetical protein